MARMEFRDGIREVPDYLADLMAGLETWTLTFQQAIEAANKAQAADYANRAMDSLRSAHLRRYNNGRTG